MHKLLSQTYKDDTNSVIRRRDFASGNRPIPPCMLSWRWVGLSVAGIVHVIAGFATIHFKKNCAHERQSNSAAQSGSGFERTLPNKTPDPNGRFAITATP